jgi:acetylornithine aminotransferase/acetylornithine/N-succinyldiaminopimelate aminotransferase
MNPEIESSKPGSLKEIQAAEAKLLIQTYERNPLLLVSGQGVHLRDEQGNEYLDLLSGIGVCALGYQHPVLTSALQQQSQGLLHTSNLFYHRGTSELALRLTEITGLDRVFFCNTGTEAWEAALKLARAHARRLRSQGRKIGTGILAMEDSFHGRTIGSLATTHKLKYREPFEPVMPGVSFVPFNNVAALRAAFSSEICAIAIEVIQGEGGIHPVSRQFLAAARELCDSTGALLLLDEIQSGMGRTGRWCAYQHYGVQPDVTTLAKPLAGGVPIGAMLCTEEASLAFTPGMHGTTFGGNPLACSLAIAVIDEIKRSRLLDHVASLGEYFLGRLRGLQTSFSCIRAVRGMGLMIGVELESESLARQILQGMMERRIILNRTHETVLRFLPPYILSRQDVDHVLDALSELLATHGNSSTEKTAVMDGEKIHG